MTWFALKYYNGNITNWHVCEECWSEGDDIRMDIVARVLNINSKTNDPDALIDICRWHKINIEDVAGTAFPEFYCTHCDEYEPNPEYAYEHVEEQLPDAVYDLRYITAAQDKKRKDAPKYFQSVPGKPPTPEKKSPKYTMEWTADVNMPMPAMPEPIALEDEIEW